ncbi:carbonic anhydrase [Pseudonocardiaceae bacterium YIM PH 21723]|nr:carbonic anhydrase [Pseudonocardiaceae bacterium YIM PH 21723]
MNPSNGALGTHGAPSDGPPPHEHGPPVASRMQNLLRGDLPASLVVFLIAIPLSLGIAVASGAPLLSGLIAAVVGGIVGGALSGAPLTVTGPAAGLTVVVADLVAKFGFSATAGIVLAAGVVQILFGLLKIGRAALTLSPAVVHGMLAGIGIVIAIGQVHVVLGGKPQSSVLANLQALPGQIIGHHSMALLVGALTIAVLLLWPQWKRLPALASLAKVPAPLVAVLLATIVALPMALPRVALPSNPLEAWTFPAMPSGAWGAIAIAVLTVAVVASVESLLSAVAIDKLQDGPRADLNKELTAQGAANLVSGALGGLPVTGVIVRGSTNVAAGAKSRFSAMLHGVWVGLFSLTLVGLLNKIPMAALAGVLVVIGLKLVSWDHIRELRKHHELPVYLVTVGGVVFVDLLTGVLLGIAMAVIRALWRMTHFHLDVEERSSDWKITVHGSLIFLGVSKLSRELSQVPAGKDVLIELHVDFMDHAAFAAIHDWQQSQEKSGAQVRVQEVHHSWYHWATRGKPAAKKETAGKVPPRWFAPWEHWQETVVPAQRAGSSQMAVGMAEFERHSADLVRPFLAQLAEHGQQPTQLFITCADSRVVPNMITSSGPGDLFTVRNIGNLVPRHGSGVDNSVGAAIEYAVDVLGVSTVVVCGHSDCGAMKALLAGMPTDSALGSWLTNGASTVERFRECGSDEDLERLVMTNVAQQLENLMTFPSVSRAVEAGRLTLQGMYFDIATAKIDFVCRETVTRKPVAL